MKRSVLILLCVTACVFSSYLKASKPVLPPSQPASLTEGGAYGNAVENTHDENWCKRYPEECQYRKELERENEIQRQQRQEREAYCERNPERCGNIIDQRQRSKYCQRYPWKCKD